jgi:hypothetical protein
MVLKARRRVRIPPSRQHSPYGDHTRMDARKYSVAQWRSQQRPGWDFAPIVLADVAALSLIGAVLLLVTAIAGRNDGQVTTGFGALVASALLAGFAYGLRMLWRLSVAAERSANSGEISRTTAA